MKSRLVLALLLGVVPLLASATAAEAQTGRWQDPGADSLVQRATARRGLQLADSTLLSYQADAHGYLAFLAQLGEGVLIPPKVVQSEELALKVSWWQPGNSAQRLVGRRDTTLLPANVAYYRDRYGVILDNLPDRIRLGDGQDVRDVPHPLATNASTIYEYEKGNPLTIRIPGRDIVVDEIKFRPRDASKPAAIGSVFLDRETAAVVRISMTFTRAAIRDQRIETLVVTLENSLIRERYWLPRKQEVEVSRGSTWLDLPVRGIVRGRWEVANYDVNERIPDATLKLPRWSSAPRDSLEAHTFEGRMIDVLPPEIQIASSEDVARARAQAVAAVSASLLTRPARARVTSRGISDFARFSRSEGLAVGAGAAHTTAGGWRLSARGRYGFGDEQVKGQIAVARAPAFGRAPLLQAFVERDYRDIALPERAGVTNSLAALAFGSDYSTQVDTRAVGITVRRAALSPWMLRLAWENTDPVHVAASPLSGSFSPTLDAWRTKGARAELRGTGGWIAGDNHSTNGRWSANAELGVLSGRVFTGLGAFDRDVKPLAARAYGNLSLNRPLRNDRAFVLETTWGFAGGRDLPPQWLIFAGGPWSAPGYEFHSFRTRGMLSQRLELRQPVPAPAFPLGRYGTAPAHVTLAPFVQITATASGLSTTETRPSALWPSAGLGVLFFFDLVRADISRGLRDGRWIFALDIDRAFWGIL